MQNTTNSIQPMSDSDKAALAMIKQKASAFAGARRAAVREIKANIAYLCGFQNIEEIDGAIHPLPTNLATPVVANKILPAVLNDLAVATHNAPRFDVIPASTTQEDEATAKVCQKLIPYLQMINGKDLARAACVLWYDLAGVGWRKIYVDDTFTIKGINPSQEHPNHDPQYPPHSPLFQPEVIIDHIPNHKLIYDTRAKNLDRLPWIIHEDTMTMSEVAQRFGRDFASQISPASTQDYLTGTNAFESNFLGAFQNMTAALTPGGTRSLENQTPQDDRLVLYQEFWHIPCVAWPQGAYIIAIGDRVACNVPYPIHIYKHGQLPFVPAAPVALWGIAPRAVSRITQARPLQREYNMLRSMILDNLDAMGNSVIFTPRGSKLNYKKIDNRAGNIIEYDGIQRPQREAGVPIPGSIFAYIQEVKQSIDEVFSFPEPSRGIAPGGVESGKGLQILQDAANMQLGPIVDGFDRADERVVRQALCLATSIYGDRVIELIGEDNSWALSRIQPQDITGAFKVIVRTGSSLPTNRALEAEKVFGLWQSGLLGDPNSPEIRKYVLKQMDLGNIDNILQQSARHVNFAQREFLSAVEMANQCPPLAPTLSQDQILAIVQEFLYVPAINSFDDHHVHIQEHTDFILENYWRFVGSGQPHLQILMQAMVDHTNAHSMALQQISSSQMASEINGQAFIRGNTLEQIEAKKAANENAAKTKSAGQKS